MVGSGGSVAGDARYRARRREVLRRSAIPAPSTGSARPKRPTAPCGAVSQEQPLLPLPPELEPPLPPEPELPLVADVMEAPVVAAPVVVVPAPVVAPVV